MRRLFGTALAAFVALGLDAPVEAQEEAGKTILVLDASGSMWGQIEGKAKITIAQEVVERILAQISPDRVLGLTAYGHRRKGDCGDIETLVAPAPGTADEILAAVNAIKPKGKTPLSAAVLAAAEALKYEEDPATVVLVSDGRETCDLDPCSVGRQLEEAGVGFTAHVVGFDVADEADRAQLRCLAEETGGRFLTASNADELTEALAEVSVAPPPPPPPPEPARTDMTFVATEGEGGPQARGGLLWSLSKGDGEMLVERMEIADLRMALAPGAYRVEVLRLEDEQTVSREVTVEEDAPATIELALAAMAPEATVEAPSSAVAGSTVAVTWTGPEDKGDFISVANPERSGGAVINRTYTGEGSPLGLVMPPEPGTYEIRYVRAGPDYSILARQPVAVTEITASLDAPSEAAAASNIEVAWTGPDYRHDQITIARPDTTGGTMESVAFTGQGNPLKLAVPPEPGEYEIRYVQGQGHTILARRQLTVSEVAASLTAPSEAEVGSTVLVEWEGPRYASDLIGLYRVDGSGGGGLVTAKPTNRSPLRVTLPAEPGSYELRYVLGRGGKILARAPITLKERPLSRQ
ncbi:MAG TPA: VWA domain-containing protein [Thermohalobaculum sp.]|nr:VWA domain-containing protein [Thermohalobaculum sp.]